MRFTPIPQALHSLFIVLALLATSACNTSNYEKYGVVETFHGRPVMPKTIPRQIIGPMPAGSFPSQEPKQIVVMDSGADLRNQTAMTYLQELLERYNSGGRGDLPAHYFIDRQGTIFTGRPLHVPAKFFHGDPFTYRTSELQDERQFLQARLQRVNGEPIDLQGAIVIMVLGDFAETLVSEEQEQALFQTIAHLTFEQDIPRENVMLFSDRAPDSGNPGFYLKNYLNWNTVEKNLPPPPGRSRLFYQAQN